MIIKISEQKPTGIIYKSIMKKTLLKIYAEFFSYRENAIVWRSL